MLNHFQIEPDAGQKLTDLVVELGSDVASFGLLSMEHPMGKALHALGIMVTRVRSLLVRRDIGDETLERLNVST